MGENIGEYNISNDNLSFSSNYNLVFNQGVFTIEANFDNIISSIFNHSATKIILPSLPKVIANKQNSFMEIAGIPLYMTDSGINLPSVLNNDKNN